MYVCLAYACASTVRMGAIINSGVSHLLEAWDYLGVGETARLTPSPLTELEFVFYQHSLPLYLLYIH